MKKTWMMFLVLAVVVTSAPAFAGGNKDNKVDPGCLKIEDAAIGVEGITASVDGVTVTFTDWVEKADSPGEYIGFDYSIEGGIFTEFDVKQGLEYVDVTLTDISGTWLNENGDSGPTVKAISHIRFCGAGEAPVMTTTTIFTPPPPPPG